MIRIRLFILRLILVASLILVPAALVLRSAEPEPAWWRGNLHTHSAWAEGDDFPEMIADWYRAHGYNFVVLTEHNLLSQGDKWRLVRDIDAKAKAPAVANYQARFGKQWVQTRGDAGNTEVRLKPYDEFSAVMNEAGRFLVIPGEEITGQAANGRAIHMNASNLAEIIPPNNGATVRDTIARNSAAVRDYASRSGRAVLLAVNHPNFKWGVNAEDLAASPEVRFFEIWNGVTDDNDPGDATHPSTDEIWDRANALRLAAGAAPLYGLANDDAHNYQGNNPRAVPGRAWVMVRAAYLSAESLFRAMTAGNFYASTGVAIEAIRFDAPTRRLALDLKAAGGETFTTQFRGLRKGKTQGEVFAEVPGPHPEYSLREGDLYVRAIVTSSLAPQVSSTEFPFRRAWTQPVGW